MLACDQCFVYLYVASRDIFARLNKKKQIDNLADAIALAEIITDALNSECCVDVIW